MILGGTPAKRQLKKDAVPSLFYWTKPKRQSAIDRSKRVANRCKQRIEQDEHFTVNDQDFIAEVTIETTDHQQASANVLEQSTQTEHVATKNMFSQTPHAPSFDLSRFQHDDKMIHFYTGLQNFTTVLFVLSTLGPAAYQLNYMYGATPEMSVLNQFLMVLMKLRRYKTNFELSHLFNVRESEVYNIFCIWIKFMSLQWKKIDWWPSRDMTSYYCPTDIKAKYPTTRVIIDGTECPIKCSRSKPTAQQSTFSTYKNRNTLKVLVGATPGGLVSYVSPAYGGSTSDRQIIERSTVPSKCDPGDSIMADKGFDVQDIFALYDVAINIPSFFRKKNQMQSATVSSDRVLASKRVHIERIIGLAKTYKIMSKPLTLSETQLGTDISFVCFTLCNFRNCIISKSA